MNAPEVIYEDDGMLALVKPAGLLVHSTHSSDGRSRGKERPTLVDWLRKHYPEVRKVGDDPDVRPGLVHRLDKDTSGIMLVARRQEEFEYLKGLFSRREIRKTYLALCLGRVEDDKGVIDAPIGIKSGTTKRSIHSHKMAKPAETEYEVIHRGDLTSLLKVLPHTGRTHQIRVHLASIKHPVAGDSMYGPRKNTLEVPRLMLHALALEFERRFGERLRLEAPPDDIFTGFLDSCGYPQLTWSEYV